MAIEFAPLVAKYGYLAAFVGAALEGETILTLSGWAAHRGYLDLSLLILLGTLGGAAGDVVYFTLGRRYGGKLFARFPKFAPSVARVQRMIERFPDATVFGIRFFYGLRTAGPAIIGTTAIAWPRFLLLNALGALVWSALWVGVGYVLGEAAQRLLGNVMRAERNVFIVVIAVAVIVTVILHVRRGYLRNRKPPE